MDTEAHEPYEKRYKMRMFDGNIAVSVPPEVIRKEAKKHGLTVEQFIEIFRLVAQYNSFDGIHYQFEKAQTTNTRGDNIKL